MSPSSVWPASAPARVASAVRPSPGTARDWVREELARRDYHRSLLERLTSWLDDRWLDLRLRASGASQLSTVVVVVLAVLLVLLLVVVASRLRREPAAGDLPDAGLATGLVAPEEHRRTADEALTQGRFEVAIVEGFRAVAARAAQRGVLEDRPGRTAHEVATDLAPVHPDHAADLVRTSGTFDAVFYGDQPATLEDARAVLALEDALRTSRAGSSRAGTPAGSGTVPR